MTGTDRYEQSRSKWGLRTTTACLAALLLAGCSQVRQDGWDDAKRTFDIPIRNATNEAPPYERVMGNPLPDHAWLRERASECEPWQVGDNGCSTPRVTTAAVRTTHAPTVHRAVHQVRARGNPHVKPKIPGS